MARRSNVVEFARCHFLPYPQRDNVPAAVRVFDVSSYAELPYRTLNPFFAHGDVPILMRIDALSPTRQA